jgi:hypothetical protein
MRNLRPAGTLLLAAIAIGLASSCMAISTSPDAPGAGAARTTATTAAVAPTRGGQQDGLVGGLIDGLGNLLVKVVQIVGALGGSLDNGRWHVAMPAGAISGTASVAIGITGTGATNCHLQILPADKNHFARPVQLTASCPEVPVDQLANYVIYWYDPATQHWVPVAGSTVDLAQKTVSAPLQHFSSYSVGPAGGRAGW